MCFRRPQGFHRTLLASLGILYRALQSSKSHRNLLNSVYLTNTYICACVLTIAIVVKSLFWTVRAYFHSHVIVMAASSISGLAIISLLICWPWDPPRLVKARLIGQNERFLAAGKFIHEVYSEYGVESREKVRKPGPEMCCKLHKTIESRAFATSPARHEKATEHQTFEL